MGHMGHGTDQAQPKKAGERREAFPALAEWVDALRAEFGPEVGGVLHEPGGVVRCWGWPRAQWGVRRSIDDL